MFHRPTVDVLDLRLWPTSHAVRTQLRFVVVVDCGLWIVDCGLWIVVVVVDCGLWSVVGL